MSVAPGSGASLPDSGLTAFDQGQLRGFRIGVTSDRRSGDLIAAFERRGAEVQHGPTIRMADAGDDQVVVDETRAIIAAGVDLLLATTSYGIRRWLEVADAAGVGEALLAGLAEGQILVRGPKARGAIRAAGLDDDGMSLRETTESLIDKALQQDLKDSRVAVQLHGYTDAAQLARLTEAGAQVLPVTPYRWLPHPDTASVHRLLDSICGGGLDAVTFTSAPAVQALFTVAEQNHRLDEVVTAFHNDVVAAAVGPVTAEPLADAGIAPLVPDRYRMGALIRLVCEHLEQHRVLRVPTASGLVELRGRLVQHGGESGTLTPVSLALFRVLMKSGGATVSRAELASSVPGGLDDHALDVALSRLRQSLPHASLVATVVKRGYRLALDL